MFCLLLGPFFGLVIVCRSLRSRFPVNCLHGFALAFKSIDGARVFENRFIAEYVCMYIDISPGWLQWEIGLNLGSTERFSRSLVCRLLKYSSIYYIY